VQVFTVEMHHKRVESAGPGDNVGMNIKGLDKGNMPRAGDVMIMKTDDSLKHVEDFTAQIQVSPCLRSCSAFDAPPTS
jgi:elongation factor 1-alpha